MRDPNRELDDRDAALDVAPGVGDRLAVLQRQKLSQLVDLGVDQIDELHHHPCAALRIPRRPHPLRLDRRRDGRINISLRGQHHLRLHLPGARIQHISGARGLARRALAVDEMQKLWRHLDNPRGWGVALRLDLHQITRTSYQ
jgi:hypothetical protein